MCFLLPHSSLSVGGGGGGQSVHKSNIVTKKDAIAWFMGSTATVVHIYLFISSNKLTMIFILSNYIKYISLSQGGVLKPRAYQQLLNGRDLLNHRSFLVRTDIEI